MQLDKLDQVEKLAGVVNFSIFELPENTDFSKLFKDSYHVTPQGKSDGITIEQIREITQITANKQTEALFIIIEQAEKMNEKAANAFLKSLEEPGENIHYVFLTKNAGAILPTIRSRASHYYLRDIAKISDPPQIDKIVLELAKAYISATPQNILEISDKISKLSKDNARAKALEVVDAGITLMYKSYLIRGNQAFLIKLEKLLKVQDALAQNGHVKLQLIANML